HGHHPERQTPDQIAVHTAPPLGVRKGWRTGYDSKCAANRLRLPVAKNLVWVRIGDGLSLGYRRNQTEHLGRSDRDVAPLQCAKLASSVIHARLAVANKRMARLRACHQS